jgi:hypothetical protein
MLRGIQPLRRSAKFLTHIALDSLHQSYHAVSQSNLFLKTWIQSTQPTSHPFQTDHMIWIGAVKELSWHLLVKWSEGTYDKQSYGTSEDALQQGVQM